ncbi:hypothetical protein QUF64_02980, partial [Anaerolineales bacterium HSG6]|nr:hypothetical protein [Anaerolineales bacterium HSG6]
RRRQVVISASTPPLPELLTGVLAASPLAGGTEGGRDSAQFGRFIFLKLPSLTTLTSHSPPYFRLVCLTVGLLLLLTACDQGDQPVQPPPQAPAQPIAAPEHTATIVPADQPTPIIADQIRFNQYTHPSNKFSIDYPDNWWLVDREDGVLFVEPGDEGGYSVYFDDVGEPYNRDRMRQYIAIFMAANLIDIGQGDEILEERTEADGTIVVQFESSDPSLGKAINELRAKQYDTVIYTVLVSTNEVQWRVSQKQLQTVIGSFTPLDTTPIVQAMPTDEPPVWVLVGPNNSNFGFFYPSNWEIIHQTEETISVGVPELSLTFSANQQLWPQADNQAVLEASQIYLDRLETQNKNLQYSNSVGFPLHELAGINIDFVYTDATDVTYAGSMISAADQGHIYQVIYTAPITDYRASLALFNPMYQSFKFLSPEELFTVE